MTAEVMPQDSLEVVRLRRTQHVKPVIKPKTQVVSAKVVIEADKGISIFFARREL